ncbi:MAG: LPS-assembly protein LptD [Flavobacterium lindanitolerans]|nr:MULTISPECIES: putative LPS assembly protein LptD [Flavobacterium]KQS45796.1 organic solvent tolerance protein OstA [Flavobacterium sp. Leaf359]MBL7868757.1 LPS-assembly protein LptD [Flavobacterium lindanitolerans]MBU7569764.1 LPS-assembly protein LptD [Flavobacterium sp.]
MARQKLSHIFTKIVFKPLRTNLFHIVLSAIFLTLGTAETYSQEGKNKSTSIAAEKQPNTKKDSVSVSLSDITKSTDTTAQDTIKPKKTFLESRVKRKAVDYEKMDQKKKQLTLYNKAELYYQDFELKAGIIVMDYEKNEVYAGRIKDSAGNYTQRPVFKQGTNVIEPDSIRFNTITKKALVWNSRSAQGELNIKGEVTKKENDSVYFIKNARITTSKNIDDPEYYFLARKLKLVPGKKVVVGLTNMVIADVPTPLGIPFAFFPMSNKGTSGLILPSPNNTNRQGFALQNGGLYLALSDNYDLAILGDYYTNGSYAMRFESSYAKRYKFRGNVNVRFENQIQSERGFPDYTKATQYNIQWTHSQDAKANPNSRFSASVNLGSSKYYQRSMNQANVGSALNNTLSSSVSYSRTFNSVPQVNMSVTATHSQNTQTETINMTLPTFQGSVDRIFPFASENENKRGLIKNLNIQYNLNAQNQITTKDSLFFKPQMFRDARVGFQHTIPVNTNFKVFKHFSVSAGGTYNEVWYMKTIEKRFNPVSQKVENFDVRGFDAFRTYNFSSSIGTTIYGTFNFGENKKIQAIRHVMRPSVSYSYTPSFAKYYDTYDPDGTGTMLKEYSRFEGGIYGAPGRNISNNIGFSLSNTFEAKVTDKDSTKTEPKKIMLLNNLNFSTSYDMTADSLKLAPLRVSGGTALFKEKMNINFAATLDPYALDNANRRIDRFNIDNGGSLFRLSSANITINYSFSSTDGTNENDRSDPLKNQGLRNGGREDDLFGTARDLGDNRQSQFNDEDTEKAEKKTRFYHALLPWNMTLAYSLTYSNSSRQNEITNNSVMISGNVDLTPRWKVGISTGYDFVQKGVTFTQLRFERDLLSWRMDFNWIPIGDYTSWGFFIGIKSSVLSDIKWDKRRQPDRRLR